MTTCARARFAWSKLAVACALGSWVTAASALGLGKLTVLSALGEPLRAEVEIQSISPDEQATLVSRIASPDAFRLSGLDYNSLLTSTQVQLRKRGDGRMVLLLTSERAVQEPFVDVIVEMNWNSGRLVREFTLLFDPPSNLRAALAEPPAPPVVVPAQQGNPQVKEAPVAKAAEPAPAARPTPTRPAPPSQEAREPASSTQQYLVRPGDTLYRVATRTRSGEVTLEQMLVGLYRNNQDAFVGADMNRLKAGVVLRVPSAEVAGAIPQPEARQEIASHSADFGAYKERLATHAPKVRQESPDQQLKGRVQPAVKEARDAVAATPDRLTLSKPGAASSEVAVSKETQRQESASRVAELSRNVQELKQLAAKVGSTAPAPGAASSQPASAGLAAPVALASASAAPASEAQAASQPASKPARKASAPSLPASLPESQPAAEPEHGLMDRLGDFAVPLVGLLVALLAGLGLMRWRARRQLQAPGETGFIESRLQPDSFFGVSGGQRVDTREGGSSQSSMSYSLSQLDAIGDVDPVAEADVYLAYGRDLQAEEILKEALRATPDRLAIRHKLLEVYAKRRDVRAFEQLAIQLYAETQGQGEDWAKVQDLGQQLDPDNPLYRPGGAPVVADDEEQRPEPMNASTLPATNLSPSTVPLGVTPVRVDALSDVDLDLDLGQSNATALPSVPSLDDGGATLVTELADSQPQAEVASDALPGLDFDLEELAETQLADGQKAAIDVEARQVSDSSLGFDLADLDLGLEKPAETTPPAGLAASLDKVAEAARPSVIDSGTVSFADLGVDLDSGFDDNDPEALQRQLDLAEEFRQIGDSEGARDVLQELIQRSSGEIQEKAQAMLKELS
ncbi:FimV/HubP family polar landmark protein [Roseateles sp. BYS180W]|uniref:FimV/HubP family polar landmark protein n=1 Tax=Roseateles rivi TaxID=3299028 RepID=A0ABW7FYB8_9BURK